MAAVEDLQLAAVLLSSLVDSDPRLCLINAIAWLDPFGLESYSASGSIEFDYDTEDELTIGLYICRECFPTVYTGVLQLQWQGATQFLIERYLLEGISAEMGMVVHALEELRYGPPLDFRGVFLDELDGADLDDTPYDQLLPIFALFGLKVGGGEPEEVADAAFLTAQVLVQSLNPHPEPVYQDLANLLLWMFSFSGNTAIDYTYEVFWENGFDTAQWTADDVAMIREINEEAHQLIQSAMNALQQLSSDSSLRRTLKRNIKRILTAIRQPRPMKGGVSHARARSLAEYNPGDFIQCADWPDGP